ncbi:hypothetical protein [Bradyrhizobium sp. F1.13.3]|uniref:hypothetical protein n=1 Tax=Bradyrhizobium sp. F1.13.3 TaxID=3156351 RepID=UPI0033917A91
MSLSDILREEKDRTGIDLGNLTVLSPRLDPYRLDTKANHNKGQWFRDQMEHAGLFRTEATYHNRGIHYAVVSLGDACLPSGIPYKNDFDCWTFLQDASNIARWLGYVSFEKVFDARNADPVIRIRSRATRGYKVGLAAQLLMPDDDDLIPTVAGNWGDARQAYQLVIYGEKTSLESALGPIAKEYEADLYLPSGEISNTLLAKMAATGAGDGREMVVAVFADCDPSGYQMAISIAHKLRAFRDLHYPNNLSFRVITPALTVEQVKEFGLPHAPLKPTELRAAGWVERYGIEQTEIDAMATLRPDVFDAIARKSLDPYFDHGLAARHAQAKGEWHQMAQGRFADHFNGELDDAWQAAVGARADLQARVQVLCELADRFNEELPGFDRPQADVIGDGPVLVSSDMPLAEHAGVLRDRKDYSVTS